MTCMGFWSNRYFNRFIWLKVDENLTLAYFVRYESFQNFAHRLLILEQGFVKPNSTLNMILPVTLKAPKGGQF